MFLCKLKIDGKFKKLSLDDGISIKDLGEILLKLSKCLEKNGAKFTLIGVENSSYTPLIDAEDRESEVEFLEVHEQLNSTPYELLDKEQKDYLDSLKRLLFENDITISAVNSKNEEVKLNSVTKDVKTYKFTSINTVTGTIVELHGQNEKKPYLTLKTSQGEIYRINITLEQEQSLKPFYKEEKIRVRIKQPIKSDREVRFVKLIDYTVLSKATFSESIEIVHKKYGDIFKNISDSAKLIKELRNSEI